MKDRVIFHIDCNGFFASVEETLHPELKLVPMAVCGDPESRRGIILAKNELAKGFGIKTAETIWQAKKKCPSLVLAPARHGLYHEFSRRVNAIYAEYTDQVEPFGIDESYLDVTGSLRLFGKPPMALANEIRARIPRETGLTVSIGVSFNKVFAKLGSDYKKPDAITEITRENFREIVWTLPVNSLLYVGKSTEGSLSLMGVKTIGDLARLPPALFAKKLGKLGEQLHLYANGMDESPVLRIGTREEPHSVGNSITFRRNLLSRQDIQIAVTALCDTVAGRLREDGLKCACVQVTIKDVQLKIITRQKQLENPSFLSTELARAAMTLIQDAWRIGKPIRMLAVTGQKLQPASQAARQLSLFSRENTENIRQTHLEYAMDKIRGKFGAGSILHGSILGNDLGIADRHKLPEEKG